MLACLRSLSVVAACILGWLLSASCCGAAAAETPISFQRAVQPILAEHCSHCHGVDTATREAELRLDVREDALRGGASGLPAIVPGDPAASELLKRVESHSADTVMPPPSQNKPLSAEQIDVLRQWIQQGAVYEAHWAFTPPQKVSLPSAEQAGQAGDHPIDRIVGARLQARGLRLSSGAAPATLCRRLYLDVTGLPPSPEQLADFEARGLPAVLEDLLNSERYGEKWARHWLDVARYSDTNGYEKDLQREQWAWRDWVISALNRDLPYNEFIVQQLAGDLLPGATQEHIIATGFLRNSMINEEGAIVPEQFRMVEMFDRMDCIGKAFLGLSTQCAQCHSHKFDPLTHEEYYGMFAFLNNSWEARSWVYAPEQLQQLEDIRGRINAVEQRLRAEHPEWQQELTAWQAELLAQQPQWTAITATELGSVSGLNHPVQEADKSLLMLGHTSADIFMLAAPELNGATGLRLELLTHGDLPHRGPGRSSTGTWGIAELEALVRAPDAADWQKLKLVQPTADFSSPEEKSADGKKSSGPVTLLVDGSDDTVWKADRGVGQRNQASVAVVQFEQPLQLAAGMQLKLVLRMTDMVGCCRFSLTRSPQPAAPAVAHTAVLAAALPAEQRAAADEQALFAAWRGSRPDLQAYNSEIDAALQNYPQAVTSILHLAERPRERVRRTHLLSRGAWDQPLDVVEPHTPAALHPFPEGAPRDRLGFAMWLADPQSPLTARVAVNRVWQVVFGEGLVETPEDFGTRAPVPEYGDLLDWLAVDFMEHGWSQKQLLRTILTSRVYQQSAQATAEQLAADPRNRLLARGSRFRADAEVIRDIALTVSGLMHHQVGGPGVIPPVPQNVLDYNYVYPSYWKPAEGAQRYRRAVYGFRKRSMPDPVMTSFDAPNGDFACARRVRSNTPLAALAGLNEPVFVEAARALALRVLREAGPSDAERVEHAFVLCTARRPEAAESRELLSLLQSQRQRLADGWLNPREIISGNPGTLPELPENATPQDAAAWTLTARVLLNLDETLSRN